MPSKAMLRNLIIVSLLLISSSAYSAALVSCIRTNPSALNINQQYTVIMGVTNTGIVDAPATTPDALYIQVPSAQVTAPVPADIPAGSYREFTWIYQAAAAGTGIITGLARSMGDVSTDMCGGGTTITVYGNPNLTQDIFIIPSLASVGQEITILMNVTNTGGSNAEGVVPDPLIKLGTGNYVIVAGPVPVNVTIAPAANQWFTWIYDAQAAGTLCVNDDVKGYAQYSKVTITSVPSSSNCITIQAPASLICGINVMPPMASVGQDVTLVLSVTNMGQADCVNVCPLPPGGIGSGGVSLISGPSCVTITGGGAAFFTWLFSADSPGVVMFTARAEGWDANSGEDVLSGICISANVGITSLAITCMSTSSPVSVGQNLTVVMNVSNTGSNNADNVVPVLTPAGDASSLVLVSGPVPASSGIAAGGNQKFTWIYNCAGTGVVSFYEEASGIDAVLLTAINAVPITCGPVSMQVPTPTCTPTVTATQCIGVGSVVVNPTQVTAGSCGNTIAFTYTNGPVQWAGSGGYGTLKITIPAGWSAPSLNPANPGYFGVWIGNGNFVSKSVSGQDIIIKADGLQANTGTITVNYGLTSMGGPGACAQIGTGLACFNVEMSPDSSNTCPLQVQSCVDVIAPTPTSTNTSMPTATVTATPFGEGSAVITPTQVTCGTCNNVMTITYTNGSIQWAGGVSYGTLKILVPPGWSAPSNSNGNKGYYTVVIAGGTMFGKIVSGSYIIVNVKDLAPYGTITVTYGAGAGGGACAQGSAGAIEFTVESQPNGSITLPIMNSPQVQVVCPSPTNTPTPTITVTYTSTPAAYAYIQPNQAICGDNESYAYHLTASGDGPIAELRIELESGVIITGGPSSSIPGAIVSLIGNEIVVLYPAGWNSASSPNFDIISFNAVSCGCKYYGSYLNGIVDARGETPNGYSQIVCAVTPTFTNTLTVTPTITYTWAPGCCTASGTPTTQSPATSTLTPTNTPEAVPPPCFITKWGSAGSGNGQFSYPAAIAIDSTGAIYVVDNGNNRIQKFDSTGTYIMQWGSPGSGSGQFNYPAGIAIDSTDAVYVSDNGNNRIQKFDSMGAYITQWGGYGNGNGQFYNPFGITVDNTNGVYVADTQNHRIQKFDSMGAYITQWGGMGSGNGQFNWPMSVATDSAGDVYVVDQSNFRVQKFDSTGAYITKWGSSGSGSGQLYAPVGIDIDNSDHVLVTEAYNNRIQEFDSTGAYITQWGNLGSGSGQFNAPWGVKADNAGNIYVADTFNNRIQKFGACGTPTATSTGSVSDTPTYADTPARTITPADTETITPTRTVSPVPTTCCTFIMTPTISPTPTQGAASTLLSIKKSVSGEPPAVGAIITYSLEVRNTDAKPAFNLMVWDTLPAQVEFLYNYSGLPYIKSGHYILWGPAVSPLNPGDVLYIDFQCRITGLGDGVPIGNYAGCDYDDASGKHAPIFSSLAFYPLGIPAVYPNPSTDHVKFTNIVPGSEIDIYTLSGEFVNSMDVQSTIVTWACNNRYNMRVSAGIYYYIIRDSNKKAVYTGKLFIMKP